MAAEEACFEFEGEVFYGKVEQREGEEGAATVRHGLGRTIVHAQDRDAQVVWSTFKGLYQDDRMHRGVYVWADGSSYDGEFDEQERPHGAGRYTWPDGSTFLGAFEDGMPHGQGRFTDGFTGEFMEGHFHRACFKRHDNTWVNIEEVVRQNELKALSCGLEPERELRHTFRRKGEEKLSKTMSNTQMTSTAHNASQFMTTSLPGSAAAPVTVNRVLNLEQLSAALLKCRDENLVPFVIRDATAPAELSDIDAALNAVYPEYTENLKQARLNLDYLALALERRHDVAAMLRAQVKTAVEKNAPATLVLPATDESSEPLPAAWGIENFVDPQLPGGLNRLIFNPKVFNGRTLWSTAAPVDDEAEGILQRPWVTALIASEKVIENLDEDDMIVDVVGDLYGSLVPFHRCRLIVLTGSP